MRGTRGTAAAAVLWVFYSLQVGAAAPTGSDPTPESVTPDSPTDTSLDQRPSANSVPAPQDKDSVYPGTLALQVDATDLARRVFSVKEILPVKPGRLTLLYPEWLPGNHAPRGPIDGLAGLTFTGNGRPVPWTRNPVNVYAFELEVPAGVSSLEAQFQFASPLVHDQGRIMVTDDIVGLQWNTVVLYPAGYYANRIPVSASLTLPDGFGFGCALDVDSKRSNTVRFKDVSLDTLVDSPVFAGRYFKSVDLDPGARVPVRLDIVADSPGALDITPGQLAMHRKLLQEAYALFGSSHFDHYDMLLALSDEFGDIGLEHHRSSENRRPPGYFVEWDKHLSSRSLLPHELTHSWNGKFRRPAGLTTANFNVPMQNSLLWVYEGLTEYLQGVLAARAGLWTPEATRQQWALTAGLLDKDRPGRVWRDLEDTTDQPIITARRPLSWVSWQRTEDYYSEGELVWLDVDTKIRELTGDKRSLDDFLRAFFGVTDGSLGPVPYTFKDIVQALHGVAPFDWDKFLTQRLHNPGPGAPLDGLSRGGWKLVYTETPSEYERNLEDERRISDFCFSLGVSVSVRDNGLITEVRWGSPAYDAGLAMGNVIVAVDGREYRSERMREAIVTARNARTPIELIVKSYDRYRVVRIPYFEGLKYPHLERVESTPDRLMAIMQPRTKSANGS